MGAVGYLSGHSGLTYTSHSSLAPYERRVIELLRNSRDKRARKLAKKRVLTKPPSPTTTELIPEKKVY